MKKLGAVAAAMLIITALMLTSGCLPKWTIAVSRLAQSNLLYDADDINQVIAMAADDYTFLVFDVSLTNNGLFEADIREDLIFALYDEADPLARYEKFLNPSELDIFDDMEYIVGSKATNEGSIFIPIPYDMDLYYAVFKVMKPNYDVLYSIPLTGMPFVSDYPDSW